MSMQESSMSARGRGHGRRRGQGTVPAIGVQEALVTELGKIQSALQTLLRNRERSEFEGRDKSGEKEPSVHSSLPKTVEGGHSWETLLVPNSSKATKGCSYKTFATCKPPTYDGACDLVLAVCCVREMELAFETYKCADEDKVTYAISILKAEAISWWDVEAGEKGSKAARGMTWEKFVERFKLQFCPLTSVKRLEDEFLNLVQGSMLVDEYVAKYSEKARFALVYVSDEAQRIDRFIWGLNANIRELVTNLHHSSY